MTPLNKVLAELNATRIKGCKKCTTGGGIESLAQVDAGNHPVSHAQNKSPMRIKFKSVTTALALCLVFQVQADALLGKVINVADGDTITLLDDTNTQHKIRLAGIDAPEKRQAFGNVSKQSLADMVAGQSVAVEWVKVDRYGRKVGKVLLAGLDCNLVQVKRGLAWHYKQYQREQSPADQQSYEAAEVEASVAKLGLWRDADPMPPWEFRLRDKSHSDAMTRPNTTLPD